jgi:feruloyl esterase
MRLRLTSIALVIGAAMAWGSMAEAAPAAPASIVRCETLAKIDLGPTASIVSAGVERQDRPDGDVNWASPLPTGGAADAAAFCKIIVRSSPSPDSFIRIEIWLPLAGWNGRMLGTGNGGYPDAISYPAMTAGLRRSFAVVGTDMGLAAHLGEPGSPPGGSAASKGRDMTTVFVDHPIRIRDFATRSTHEMALLGKLLVRTFYGQAPVASYFAGCSTGGMQGMGESQDFPADFDGILAGDPGSNRARVHLAILWDYLATWHRPDRTIPAAKLQLLNRAALRHCLALEGAPAGQAFLDRPEQCSFDPRPLACASADEPGCLTAGQLETAVALYQGPRNVRTGEHYAPGLPPGSELGWVTFMRADATVPFLGLFQAAIGRSLDFTTFDWDRDAQSFIDVMGPQIDAFSPDIRAFAERDGKLLLFYGGADALTPVADIVDYHARVDRFAEDLGAREAKTVHQAMRLFIVPGMDHCLGGPGPSTFDGLGALIRWREQGVVPASLVTTSPGKAPHLACAFPAAARNEQCTKPRDKTWQG